MPATCTPGVKQQLTIEIIDSAATRYGFELTAGLASEQVDWTPPATDAGNVVLYVAGNAANGDGSNSGDHIYTSSIEVPPRAWSTAQALTWRFRRTPGLRSRAA